METYLVHHGILGMHWGIRRYQNKDGSLTAEGKKRYSTDEKFKEKYDKYESRKEFWQSKKGKTIKASIVVGSVAAASVLAAYGGLKQADYIKSKKEVTSVLEPFWKNKAENTKMRTLEEYKTDIYKHLGDDWRDKRAQDRYNMEIENGKKQIKDLIKDTYNYKGRERTEAIRNKFDRYAGMFGGYKTRSPLEIWKSVYLREESK